MKNRVFVTGGSGFVGSAVIRALDKLNRHSVIATRTTSGFNDKFDSFVIDQLGPKTDWQGAFHGCDTVIHLAARIPTMNDKLDDPILEFRKVNTEGTLNLARQASNSGIKRFIYLSSIKVNGESTKSGEMFLPDSQFKPSDPYGLSKYEAEQGLLKLAKNTAMEVVIIRPPLVYGPGVKANFASMIKWVHKGIPLPFGSVSNQRSLVSLDNLISFIICCLDHPKAANEVFLISDVEDVSTSELLKKIAKALGKKAFLVPIPVSLMKLTAKLLGKGDISYRLFGSLVVDSSKAKELLGWEPIITMDEVLKKTADTYLKENNISTKSSKIYT